MMTYLLPLVFLTVGCKRPPQAAPDSQAHGVQGTASGSITADPGALDALRVNFERVHFETDSERLTPDAERALEANAGILQRYPRVVVEVQGHADERGTIDYNLALGQRRARTVVAYLQQRGVASSRLAVVSLGEEQPLQRGSNEVAWAANRRAEFRVLEGADGRTGVVD